MSDDNTDRLEAARHFYKTGEWSNCRDIYEDIINRLVDRLDSARVLIAQARDALSPAVSPITRARLDEFLEGVVERRATKCPDCDKGNAYIGTRGFWHQCQTCLGRGFVAEFPMCKRNSSCIIADGHEGDCESQL